jgi:hypothetical protein
MSPFAHATPAQYVERYENRATSGVTSQVSGIAPPQLTQVADVAAAPWLPDALEQLRELKAAGANLPGFGDFTLTDATIDRARQVLTVAGVTRLSAPEIVPFSGGGLAASWSQNTRELVLCVYPDREVTFERRGANGVVADDGELASDADLDAGLKKVVEHFAASLT